MSNLIQRKHVWVLSILCLVLFVVMSGRARDLLPQGRIDSSPDYTDSASELVKITPIGRLLFASAFEQLVSFQVKENVAYVAVVEELQAGKSRIDIVDVSSSTKPRLHASLPIDSGPIQCVDVSARYLVAAVGFGADNNPVQNTKLLIYDIASSRTPTLLTQHMLPYNRCQALHISEDHAYLATYDGIVVFDLPSVSSTQLLPKRDIHQILTLNRAEPFTVLVGGYCSGKWGCTTFVESTVQHTALALETSNRKEWGGNWFNGVSAWHDLLFLSGSSGLIIQRITKTEPVVGLCSIHSEQSILDPFWSAIHFVGAYGIHLTERNKITSVDFSNISFPQQGPAVQHPTEALAIESEGKFVYVVDKKRLTVYETAWVQSAERELKVEETNKFVQLTREATEKMCVDDTAKLVDEQEVEALLAIHNALGGDNWGYTGQIWAGKTYQDYSHFGPWPIDSITQDRKTIRLSESANPCGWTGVTCSCDGHITELSLGLRNAQGDVPPEIGYLGHLEKLDLSYLGGATSLPPEMSRLKKLRSLYLTFGATSNPEVMALPDICVTTQDGATGPGCDAQLDRSPKPGCTYLP